MSLSIMINFSSPGDLKRINLASLKRSSIQTSTILRIDTLMQKFTTRL